MSEYNRYIALAGVIVLGLVVQAMLVALYAIPAPYKTAVGFTKAYYKLDASMEKYLCEDSREIDDVNVTAQHIYDQTKSAKSRGFRKSYLKSQLYNIETHTTYSSGTEATVAIALVTKLFHIGGTYPVEGTIDVMKENGKWKVCASSFSRV